MQPAGELAQLLEAGAELVRGVVEQLGVSGSAHPGARHPQHQRERDEPLLRAVVQVALEPPALLVAGLDEPRARGDQVRARLRARHRQRHQLAELPEPVLGFRRERVLAGDRDRAPQRAATTIGAAALER